MRSRAHSVLSPTLKIIQRPIMKAEEGEEQEQQRSRVLLWKLVMINNRTRCRCIDLLGCGLTSLGGVKVPSTSNRQRMFRSDEKLFDVSISSSLLSVPLVYKLHCWLQVSQVHSCANKHVQIHVHVRGKMTLSIQQSVSWNIKINKIDFDFWRR